MCSVCDECDRLIAVLKGDEPVSKEDRERLIEFLEGRKEDMAEASGEGW